MQKHKDLDGDDQDLILGDKFSMNPDKYFAVENVFGGLKFYNEDLKTRGSEEETKTYKKKFFNYNYYILSQTDCILGYLTQHVSHFYFSLLL